jgi:L-amino acid N-acyltransferase YncA
MELVVLHFGSANPDHERRFRRRIAIRDARRADLPSILDVANRARQFDAAGRSQETWDSLAAEMWFAEHDRSPTSAHPILVASVRERVVAFACYAAIRARKGYPTTKAIVIQADPDGDTRNAERALLVELIARAQSHGIIDLLAVTPALRATKHCVHRELGFERIALLPTFPGVRERSCPAQLWLLSDNDRVA